MKTCFFSGCQSYQMQGAHIAGLFYLFIFSDVETTGQQWCFPLAYPVVHLWACVKLKCQPHAIMSLLTMLWDLDLRENDLTRRLLIWNWCWRPTYMNKLTDVLYLFRPFNWDQNGSTDAWGSHLRKLRRRKKLFSWITFDRLQLYIYVIRFAHQVVHLNGLDHWIDCLSTFKVGATK